MRSKFKALGSATFVAVCLAGAGCSGINTSHSISPATFLLPGLLKAEPQPAQPEATIPPAEPEQKPAQS